MTTEPTPIDLNRIQVGYPVTQEEYLKETVIIGIAHKQIHLTTETAPSTNHNPIDLEA